MVLYLYHYVSRCLDPLHPPWVSESRPRQLASGEKGHMDHTQALQGGEDLWTEPG